ncbi:MAG: SDR family oxidoreductase [Proteobacteria bacterium]|nr:SDR family oxidoreductase [Pseudomonadota bacterium]HQR03566.1 SDR family NAD(P)-dependent oxidoreductase [Rhodocyclaceae bacterium]
MIDLKGKIALVTGAGAGIGRAIAETFARLGARVVAAEIDPARAGDLRAALDAIGGGHSVVVADVRDGAQVRVLLAGVEKQCGRLDILVNNVGDFLGIAKPFDQCTDEDFDNLYAVNLRHIFLVTREAIPLMKKTGPGGSIISVSTIEAFRGIPNGTVYSAFKAGITGFTRSLALELGPHGLRVNAIAPETTETAQVSPEKWILPQYKDLVSKWIPVGRFGEPADCAGAAVFLASELSAWVSGTTIHVDGGALAAGGWYRTRDGRWTNVPVVEDSGLPF